MELNGIECEGMDLIQLPGTDICEDHNKRTKFQTARKYLITWAELIGLLVRQNLPHGVGYVNVCVAQFVQIFAFCLPDLLSVLQTQQWAGIE